MRNPWSRELPDTHWDVIVIGSGIGGLSCAAMLALRGQRVLVLEQHHTPGGLIQTFVRGRFRFDTGLHVIGELQPDGLPARLLTELTGGTAKFERLGPVADRLHTAAGIVDLPAGREALIRSLDARFPGCRKAVTRHLDAIERASREAGVALLARGLPEGMDDLLDREQIRRGWQVLRQPAEPWVREQLGEGPHAEALLTRTGYHGTPLSIASAGAHASVTHHYVDGAWAPAGDARDITRGLARTVAGAGGWVSLGKDVEEIELRAGRATGVRLRDGTSVEADHIVSAAGAHNTLSLLREPPQTWAFQIRSLPQSQAHIGLYLGLDTDPAHLGATRASHWARVHDPRLHGVYLRFPTVGTAGPHRATLTSYIDPDLFGSPGPHRERGDAYEARKQELTQLLLDRSEQLFPGLGATVAHAELSTPFTTMHYARAPEGAIYGLAATVDRFITDALHPRTPIPGLVLAGADVGMPGVVGGLLGGAYAAMVVYPRSFGTLARARVP